MEHKNTKPPFCTKEELVLDYVINKLGYFKIAKKYKTSIRRVKKYLNLYDIKTKPKFSIKDLTSQKFGRLIALEYVDKKSRKRLDSSSYWKCECRCGNLVIVRTSSLLKGLTRSCGCLKKELTYNGYFSLSGSYISRIIQGAIKRNLTFNVSKDFLWDLYIKQNKKCALSGLSIELTSDYTHKRNDQTASLDRIDNDHGYEPHNVRWVHKDINMMRRNVSDDRFVYLCKNIARSHA